MESTETVPDLDFMEDGDRLPKVPAVLRVSRREIFALAAKERRLTIQSQKTTEVDEGMFITKIEIGNMLAKESYDRETKEFSGKPACAQKLSIENAYHAALQYLENEKRVKIDDYNAEHVTELKAQVFSSNTWLMLFEDKAKKPAHDLSAKHATLREFLSSFDLACHETSALLPLVPVKQRASPRNKTRQDTIPGNSKTDTASVFYSLSEALLKLRAQLVSLVETSGKNDKPPLPEQAASSPSK